MGKEAPRPQAHQHHPRPVVEQAGIFYRRVSYCFTVARAVICGLRSGLGRKVLLTWARRTAASAGATGIVIGIDGGFVRGAFESPEAGDTGQIEGGIESRRLGKGGLGGGEAPSPAQRQRSQRGGRARRSLAVNGPEPVSSSGVATSGSLVTGKVCAAATRATSSGMAQGRHE